MTFTRRGGDAANAISRLGCDGEVDGVRAEAKAGMFEKGQSKRIWGELYKVVDSSDVIIQVLDVRDPMGTRCYHLEQHLKKDAMKRHKHMILLLNKVDLVPAWVTKRWSPHCLENSPRLLSTRL